MKGVLDFSQFPYDLWCSNDNYSWNIFVPERSKHLEYYFSQTSQNKWSDFIGYSCCIHKLDNPKFKNILKFYTKVLKDFNLL